MQLLHTQTFTFTAEHQIAFYQVSMKELLTAMFSQTAS